MKFRIININTDAVVLGTKIKKLTFLIFISLFILLIISGLIIIKKKSIPVFSNLKWQDNNNLIEKAHIDDSINISLDVEGISNGSYVQIQIYDFFEAYETQDLVDKIDCEVKDGKIEVDWKIITNMSNDNSNVSKEMKSKKSTKLYYYFIATYNGFESAKSELLNIRSYIDIQFLYEGNGEPAAHSPMVFYMPSGEEIRILTDENGYVKIFDIVELGEYMWASLE